MNDLTQPDPLQADSTQRKDSPANDEQQPKREAPLRPLPEDAVIILPVRNVVLFPGIVIPLAIGREPSQAAGQEAVRLQRPVGILLQNKPDVAERKPEDFVAGMMDIGADEKQALLETFDLKTRLDKMLELLSHRIEVLKVSKEISDRTRESIDDANRKHLLREQMRSIQKELGEGDEGVAEIAELEKAITEAKMPEEVEKHARKELKRLERMPEAAGEYSMIRTYLEWLIELPWADEPAPSIDIAEARGILDEDHYGLEKIKRRILEYLAVRKLNPSGRSPILCFVGPPGVGKTSLGQSIARATGRKFARVSLGGVHDEAEIRGHRRTYVGALPGNIVQALRKIETRNAVMMLAA